MEISEYPFDNRFHDEVKKLEITDPDVDNFFFDLGAANKQTKKNLMIEKKYRELRNKLSEYTEDQILQYASVFLKFGTNAQLYTGTLMKEWNEQPESTKKKAKAIQKEVEETTQSMRSGVLESVEKTTET